MSKGFQTYICGESRCDVEGYRKREMAGGRVQTGLYMSAMTSDTDRLAGSSLVQLLDLLFTLQTY